MKLARKILTRKAHAKLNLFLEVTGKLHGGYHELYSLVVFLDLADEITVESASEITVSENNYNSGITDNIIYKTADKLKKEYDVKTGAKITFTKNIPIGGGLGGGSADAAVTLVLLNNLWDLDLTHDEMYGLALELGADVPVCLYSILENQNAAVFKGVGNVIAPAPKIPKMFFTLANPAIQLLTKDVFDNFKYEGLGYEPLRTKGNFFTNISQRSNDLEPVAIELIPEIEIALIELSEAKNCQLARMTGSGATSFGIFKNKKDARAIAIKMIKNHPNWQIGPVGLKEITPSPKRKLKRKALHKQINIFRHLPNSQLSRELDVFFNFIHVKTRWGRAITFSLMLHIVGLLFYMAILIPSISNEPEYITVALSNEKPFEKPLLLTPPPQEVTIEPAAGEELPPIVEIEEIEPVAKKPAAPKEVVKKLGKKPGFLNAKVAGNSKIAKKTKPKDYLELLQYAVQERSQIHNIDPNLRGKAVLRLVFNRQGYVLTYKLKQSTGEEILDEAAEKLAKNLMEKPLPPVPASFERGEEILQYDFAVSYPPKAKI